MKKLAARYEAVLLPWPPTANNMKIPVKPKKKGGGHRMISSPEARKYYETTEKCLERSNHVPGRVAVHIYAYPPDRRRRDLGNIEKAICDSLKKGGVIEDDCLIDDLRLFRREVHKPGGKVLVTIQALTK